MDFGGVASSYIYLYSDTMMFAYAPVHSAGVVDITVTAPGGTSAHTGVTATGQWTRRGNKIVLHGV